MYIYRLFIVFVKGHYSSIIFTLENKTTRYVDVPLFVDRPYGEEFYGFEF